MAIPLGFRISVISDFGGLTEISVRNNWYPNHFGTEISVFRTEPHLRAFLPLFGIFSCFFQNKMSETSSSNEIINAQPVGSQSNHPAPQMTLNDYLAKLNAVSSSQSLAWSFFDKPQNYKDKIICKVFVLSC
jgi:hypothetical protein